MKCCTVRVMYAFVCAGRAAKLGGIAVCRYVVNGVLNYEVVYSESALRVTEHLMDVSQRCWCVTMR